jgi:hypothetical protein
MGGSLDSILLMDLYDTIYLRGSMIFIYRVILASESLLDFALDFCEGALHSYYEAHLEEEAGHSEMLLEDLKEAGVIEVPRCHLAAAFAGSQYYLVAHDHPALLLGYMQTLESHSMPMPQVIALQQHHRLRLSALEHHAKHDPNHARALAEQISRQPPELQSAIDWNRFYCGSFLVAAERQLQEKGRVY